MTKNQFYRRGSQEKTLTPRLGLLLLPAQRNEAEFVLTGPAISGFSPSGFHRLFATKPVRSETHKQNGCQVATMVLLGTRGPLLCWVIRGGLE
jgi:hypothetical protein